LDVALAANVLLLKQELDLEVGIPKPLLKMAMAMSAMRSLRQGWHGTFLMLLHGFL